MGGLRIAILSDLHIAGKDEIPFGVDTRANFLSVLDLAIGDEPDLIILGGDQSYRDGDREVYLWIKKQLEKKGVPYRVISGNHDNPAALREVFHPDKQIQDNEFYYTETINGKELIFCDSTTGTLSERQWSWLKEKIEESKVEAFIFMHHPPFNCGVPYMDNNHPFHQMEEFAKLISSTDKNLCFFCGHYHCEKTVIRNNATVFISPSTFFNLNDRQVEFEIQHNIPSFRRLIIEDGKVETSVFYKL